MQLDWQLNTSDNSLTFEIDNIKYYTLDGGQNIKKYIDGEYVTTLRQFSNSPVDWVAPFSNPPYEDGSPDEWCDELDWLLENYSHIIGEEHRVTTYRNRDGIVVDEERILGRGANNLTDLIPVNRIGIPANIQERWDWEVLATSHVIHKNAPDGISWSQNKNTKEIIRHGSGQSCPCHVYPEIFPITQIALDQFNVDVEKFQGTIFVDPSKS